MPLVPYLRQIALNANSGAFVNVLAVGTPRSIEFTEDEAASTQGLQIKSLDI